MFAGFQRFFSQPVMKIGGSSDTNGMDIAVAQNLFIVRGHCDAGINPFNQIKAFLIQVRANKDFGIRDLRKNADMVRAPMPGSDNAYSSHQVSYGMSQNQPRLP